MKTEALKQKEDLLMMSKDTSKHETTIQMKNSKKQAMSLHLELLEIEIDKWKT